MRSVSEIRRENLLKVLDSKGLNRTDLAKLVGRSVQQISAVCTGYKPIGSKLAREIEKALSLEPNFLDTDRNVEEVDISLNSKRIPILSWVQAGNPRVVGDLDYSDWLVVENSLPDGCFALRVRGDSMIPEFNEDDIIVINPLIRPTPGDFVIARVCSVSGNCETTLKRYAIIGMDDLGREIFELRPLNTLYAPLRSDKVQIEVTGVVVENHKKYR